MDCSVQYCPSALVFTRKCLWRGTCLQSRSAVPTETMSTRACRPFGTGRVLNGLIASAMPHALIVEDDPNSLSGLSAIVAADGFSVDTAISLAEARAALSRFIPDVVLIDLNLPDGSGLDLLSHLPAQPDGVLPV